MTLAELWAFGITRLSYWEGYEDATNGRSPQSGRHAYLIGYRAGLTDSERERIK